MLPTVRPAGPDDAPEVLRLLRAMARERKRPAPAFGEEGFLLQAFGPAPLVESLVVPSGDRLLGVVLLYPAFDAETGSAGMHVADLFVEPEHRRHGIGRALAAAAARRCRERGGSWITLRVESGDAGAHLFCEHTGARPLRLQDPMRLEGDAFGDLADTAP